VQREEERARAREEQQKANGGAHNGPPKGGKSDVKVHFATSLLAYDNFRQRCDITIMKRERVRVRERGAETRGRRGNERREREGDGGRWRFCMVKGVVCVCISCVIFIPRTISR
jgi:hypothetical protein